METIINIMLSLIEMNDGWAVNRFDIQLKDNGSYVAYLDILGERRCVKICEDGTFKLMGGKDK